MKKIAKVLAAIFNIIILHIGICIFDDKWLEFTIILIIAVSINDALSIIEASEKEN